MDLSERTPELVWPNSVQVYDVMPNDGQLKGLEAGTFLPIQRFRWMLDRNGSSDEVLQHFSRDYRLPIRGEDDDGLQDRRRNRFIFKQHLPQLLKALRYGHYGFEQYGEIGEDGLWHIKKLAPRPPGTIAEINVAQDGGLESIKQSIGASAKTIPVNRLLWYVWDMDGANWVGRSMYRAVYRNWLIKDRLLRVDATKHERNGMGVPVAEAPQDASPEAIRALDVMMQKWRAGEQSGGAIPHGSSVKLVGTEGQLPNTIESIRFHNEEMSTAFLEMFMDLGSTKHGSRSMADAFIDFFAYSQEAIADWICDTFNAHQIEDDADWNFGPDEQVPLLVYERGEDEELAIADFVALVDKGVIKVDPELEDFVRSQWRLPEVPEAIKAKRIEQAENPPTPPTPPPPGTPPVDPESDPANPSPAVEAAQGEGRRSGARRTEAAEGTTPSPLSLPDRDLRRQPSENEIRASVDFKALDDAINGNVDDVVAAVEKEQPKQIDQIVKLIEDADGDVVKLSQLQADAVSEDTILAAMQKAADAGIDLAEGEATRQGVSVKRSGLPAIEDSLAVRAQATDQLLARSLSEAAARRAIALTADSQAAKAVAAQTKAYLESLTGTYLRDQLNGAVMQAMNTGRKSFMDAHSPESIESSELLDESSCEPCTNVDGTEYPDLAAAESDYPTGGYMDCLGGPRCRGTLVAVYAESAPTLEEPNN